ncbi:MAG: ATP-binding protein [Pseudomonadales bacterium]|nr:ATP-binding protein [Pseudomonadales bacterium]
MQSLADTLVQLGKIGDQPGDSTEDRLRHRLLVYMAALMAVGGLVWGTLSVYFNANGPAVVPYGYVVLTIANLSYLYATKNFRVVREVQIGLSLLLPFFFQWVLGGFAASGGMMLWAMLAIVGTHASGGWQSGLAWGLGFIALTLVSGVIDADMASRFTRIHDSEVRTAFFVINITMISAIMFSLTSWLLAHREVLTQKLQERQEQLEVALRDADDARRALDLRVAERTLDFQTAHDRLSFELRERNRIEDERKLLESELQHAQRLESVGQLAGGVAHDFNNLLTVIAGNVALVLDEPSSITATQLEFLSEVQAATERAASVTGQLLAYSRKQALVLETIEAHSVVEGMRGMIERAAGEQTTVEIESPGSIGTVRAGQGQIEQVLMNLALNAYDAMPNGGTLRIEMIAVETLPSFITQSPASQKPHVVLRVSDTGEGMDEAKRCRVLEPFFSTKEPGKGTGLGLAVVDSIVTQHHGFLNVQSALGQGSCFSVYLPIVEAVPSTTQDLGATAVTSSGRGQTVLLIEDDAAVRRVTSGLLKNKGYNVLVADGGPQALDIAQNHSGSFDLFLTDVVMPELQGPELVSSLLELYPDAAVLFVSGYTDPERFADLALNDRRSFLQKPFSSETLEYALRTLLKPPSSAR